MYEENIMATARELGRTLRECTLFLKSLKIKIKSKEIELNRIQAERKELEFAVEDAEWRKSKRHRPNKKGECGAFGGLASDGFCYPI